MKTLLTESRIRAGVESLAEQLNVDYRERPLTLLGVMTGSVVLLADLIRLLRMPLQVDLVRASSYRSGMVRGELTFDADFWPEVSGHEVLLLDDIFDTGHTLAALLERFGQLGPRTLKSAVLLKKAGRQEVAVQPDYVVFDIPDEFVVGYGLDYQNRYRNLPYLAALESHDLSGAHEFTRDEPAADQEKG